MLISLYLKEAIIIHQLLKINIVIILNIFLILILIF